MSHRCGSVKYHIVIVQLLCPHNLISHKLDLARRKHPQNCHCSPHSKLYILKRTLLLSTCVIVHLRCFIPASKPPQENPEDSEDDLVDQSLTKPLQMLVTARPIKCTSPSYPRIPSFHLSGITGQIPAPQAPSRHGNLPRCQHELLTKTISNLSTSVSLRLGTYERVDNCQLPTTFCFLR